MNHEGSQDSSTTIRLDPLDVPRTLSKKENPDYYHDGNK